MVREKILITYTTGENARRPDFYDYMNMLEKPDGSMILPCHYRSPASSRNKLIEAAKEHDCSRIVFIDDDMGFAPDTLIKLLEHDVDIVTGLYLGRSYPHPPVIFDLADDNGSASPMYLTEKPYLKPIVAAGFGFMVVKMSVFDKLEKPYIRLGELNAEEWCDDIGFFNRVRKAGITSLYCDMNVPLGHMGSFVVWPEYKDGRWLAKYDTGGTGAIATPLFSPDMKYEFREEQK